MRERREKGKLIREVVNENTTRRANLKLDTSSMKFFAIIDEERFEHKNGDKVLEWIVEKLKTPFAVEWIELIKVRIGRGGYVSKDSINGACEVDASREFVAKFPKGWRIQHEYNRTESFEWSDGNNAAAKNGGVLALPIIARVNRDDKKDSVETWLKFDKQLWSGLLRISKVVEMERSALIKLVTEAGIEAKLTAIATGQPLPLALSAGPAPDGQ